MNTPTVESAGRPGRDISFSGTVGVIVKPHGPAGAEVAYLVAPVPQWCGVGNDALAGGEARVVHREDGESFLVWRMPGDPPAAEPEAPPALTPAKARGSLRQRVERARCRGILRLERGGAV